MSNTKEEQYKTIIKQMDAIWDSSIHLTGNLSNITALIKQEFNFWWVGFYFVNSKDFLELGPFQGPVACTLIAFGKGVCGKSWSTKETIIVPNVHLFEGHIACSSVSNSEIVVPIIQNNTVLGVLDIDSELYDTFDKVDKLYLEKICEFISNKMA